ncbi:helix-hairpin-helix domain-containing protein [Inediibacterium massiliense]|uniref:helix-hairpin-helix domain-containing protein n=1 Tax=Inediibacterium massiliense TaxID=1658111 RepID=UPI0006B62F0A|nr:helix-hairpin-helix domain-containing protein [Inediibacterium massiliense]
MEKFKKKEIILLGVLVVGICFIGMYKHINESQEMIIEESIKKNSEDTTEDDKEEVWMMVDVCGEVNMEGVVKIKKGDRIIDAVTLAGGLKETADRRKINMAQKLSDGEQVYIPKIGEYIKESDALENQNSNDKKLDINTASITDLESLNGIGTALAQRIIEYRDKNGNFKKIEDIMNVSGIGKKKFENIQDQICTH